MSPEEKATANAGDMEAIVDGLHGNPFAVLGPHEVDGGLAIRAFLPQAQHISVQIQGQTFPLTRYHWDGFFEAVVPGVALGTPYQFQVHTHSGDILLYEDPYAFGPTLSDTDRYLLAEGTHGRLSRAVLSVARSTISGSIDTVNNTPSGDGTTAKRPSMAEESVLMV